MEITSQQHKKFNRRFNCNAEYLTAPIELYRLFMDDSDRCLTDVLAFFISNCNEETYEQFANFHDCCDLYDIEDSLRTRYDEVLAKRNYSGVTFSISARLFADFYRNSKSDDDKAELLAALALKSIAGKSRKPVSTCSEIMFMRMAGYGSKRDFENAEIGSIARYSENDRRLRYYSDKWRSRMFSDYPTITTYSEKGTRGFFVIHDGQSADRAELMAQCAESVAARKAKSRKNEYKTMMRNATLQANPDIEQNRQYDEELRIAVERFNRVAEQYGNEGVKCKQITSPMRRAWASIRRKHTYDDMFGDSGLLAFIFAHGFRYLKETDKSDPGQRLELILTNAWSEVESVHTKWVKQRKERIEKQAKQRQEEEEF